MNLKCGITPKQFKDIIKKNLQLNNPKTIMVWGGPGIGKTEICYQLGEEEKTPIVSMILTLYDPTEVKGLMIYDPELKIVRTVPMIDLPKERFIFLIDEINTAPPAVRDACLRIIQEKKIADTQLPEDTMIILAGNRNQDKINPSRFTAPFINRCCHLMLEPSFDDWKEWGYVSGNIHPSIYAYLQRFPEHFVTPPSIDRPFCTPRSWKNVSDVHQFDNPFLVYGFVGEDVGINFFNFIKHCADIEKDLENIFKGKNIFPEPSQIERSWMLATILPVSAKNDEQIQRLMEYSTKAPEYWNTFAICMIKNMVLKFNFQEITKLAKSKYAHEFSQRFKELQIYNSGA
ncbi:MAG TPA: MoxR family ATPase [Atribacter sp.]|jgi:hypothetical protein|uniref:ATP-binding protein n=1 Tax=Atribacter sp. TaxID=2847780 RepID=UPI001776B6C8|nr:MoxR family ATPase [Atribacter sp.]MDI9594970.1 MoxR family ATPase [Atribacterota bacterium]HHT09086.1 AAA domain-containing protein [Candidatus Atribacteria bacterium]HQK82684.1 MoxR family ATPase [Atribacter sp.]